MKGRKKILFFTTAKSAYEINFEKFQVRHSDQEEMGLRPTQWKDW